jgi:hypothetical protein
MFGNQLGALISEKYKLDKKRREISSTVGWILIAMFAVVLPFSNSIP